ncbi:MAG: GNAT family N-acetyltransferase [Alphaproteobacteria bacterium]|nr:GNAT family N-acetyltransferase [Alphaproteobacteria bacterium]MDA8003659.1 GNAT family N-acetyltransferase [Alphaproteobacteria bacterium]MDA8004935.1 GNAT family N-acetyltransferase [Alphaproteobacteria bacterium]MDA8012345.1 GNAT family N-acetyltransferase [Alphaproteobacteria bacterium]
MSASTPQIGEPVADTETPPTPDNITLSGRYVSVSPLSADKHGTQLFSANRRDEQNLIWTYMPYGPFDTLESYIAWLRSVEGLRDPVYFALTRRDTGEACGVASYLRIKPRDRSIEVGHINFSPLLQNTVAATEAMFLMMQWAFDNGYRRYEWKCDALNLRSRRAAQRLGLSYEGIFRQATVYKGRNRDTAWFAAIDKEWLRLKGCFQTYLDPDNFDSDGVQKVSLSALTGKILFKRDPTLS